MKANICSLGKAGRDRLASCDTPGSDLVLEAGPGYEL
jgi:hypothetical protein